jgi:hypothetical protein
MKKVLILFMITLTFLGCSTDNQMVEPIEGVYTGYLSFENTWLNPPNSSTSLSGLIEVEVINTGGIYSAVTYPYGEPLGEFIGDVATHTDEYFVNGVQTLYHITTLTVMGNQLYMEQLTNIYDVNTSELDSFFTGVGILSKQ